MNNACLKTEQPTLIEMMAELNRLQLENECLKADKSELIKERDEWKEGFTILHNMIEEEKEITKKEFLNNTDSSMLNEYEFGIAKADYEEYANELNNCSVRGYR